MDTLEMFLQELSDIQEKYGLYLTTEYEEEIYVSLEPNPNNHNVVCMTGKSYVDPLDYELAQVDLTNLLRMAEDA